MTTATSLDMEPLDTVADDVLTRATAAVAALRAIPPEGPFPPGMDADSLDALVTVMDSVARAAAEARIGLTPADASTQLGMSRASVMRLIARGELPARKEGGHYILSPRDLRLFEARLAGVRREAMSALKEMVDEFG